MRPRVSQPVGPETFVYGLKTAGAGPVLSCWTPSRVSVFLNNNQACVCWTWEQPGALLRQHFVSKGNTDSGAWRILWQSVSNPHFTRNLVIRLKSTVRVTSCSAFWLLWKCQLWKQNTHPCVICTSWCPLLRFTAVTGYCVLGSRLSVNMNSFCF